MLKIGGRSSVEEVQGNMHCLCPYLLVLLAESGLQIHSYIYSTLQQQQLAIFSLYLLIWALMLPSCTNTQ